METKNELDTAHIREPVDGAREYVMHPADNDLFVRTGRQVIEACRLGISVEVWFGECNAMLEKVTAWAQEHVAKVTAAYAVPGGAGIRLFVVPKSETFDFDLADELADLNRELVQKFNVGTVEIHQVPADEVSRFVVPEEARQVFSDANGTHQPVET